MVIGTAAFAVGIWAARHGTGFNGLYPVAAMAALLLFAPENRVRGLVLLFAAAGYLLMTGVNMETPHAVSHLSGQTVTLTGVVSEAPRVKAEQEGRWQVRYLLEADGVFLQQHSEKATGRIWIGVTQEQASPMAGYGDRITATGRLQALRFYKNPGQPDIQAMLAADGLHGRMSVKAADMKVQAGGKENSFTARAARWRMLLRQRMEDAMPASDAAVLMGMVFGGYEGIERQTVQDYSTTGIVHILSVSGAHVALLAGGIIWLGRRMRMPLVTAAWSAGFVVAAYAMVCGFSAPVVRSVLMGGIGLFALGSGRRANARQALWLSCLGMLVFEPRNLFDIGFQLSFGCTAGLLYLLEPFLEVLRGFRPFIREAAAATLAAEAAVLPLLSWYFGVVPVASLAAAILVVPILETAIVTGLAASILAGFFTGAAHGLFLASSLMIGAANTLNALLASWPLATVPVPPRWVFCFALYYFVLFWWAGLFSAERIPSLPVFMRRYAGLMSVLLFCALGLAAWSILSPGKLEVHFIDVGQGDATLVLTPHRRAILIDAGGTAGPPSGFDPGERVVVPYLRHVGVSGLDWLILTHAHEDHAGGAAAVARMVGIRYRADNSDESSPTGSAVLRLNAAQSNTRRLVVSGTEELELDGVRITLLTPTGTAGFSKAEKAGRKSSENELSVVVKITYKGQCFLVTGDLEGEGEAQMAQQLTGTCQVLKVGHHGARQAAGEVLLKRINPSYAVISVGEGNRYGHPHPETLQRLNNHSVRVLRTDRDGAVIFRTDGDLLQVEKQVE
jgi:competence protein ComEC